MQVIRQNLRPDVDQIVNNAGQLADWRYYVKSYPWGSVAAATILGYLVIPRKLEIISPNEDEIAKLAKDNRLVVEHKPQAETKPGFVESLFNLTGSMLLRVGLSYLGQQAGRIFGEHAAKSPTQTAEVEP